MILTIIFDFKDDYFDWIYIDTDHSYPTTIGELEAYAPKIKENGIIGFNVNLIWFEIKLN